MNRYTLPNDTELKKYVSDNLNYFTSAVHDAVGALSDEYFNTVNTHRRGWKIMGWSAVLVVVAFASVRVVPLVGMVLVGVSVAGVLAGIRMVRSGDRSKIVAVIKKAELALLPLVAAAVGVNAIQLIEQRKKDKKDFDTTLRKPGENIFAADNRLAAVAQQLRTTYEEDILLVTLEKSALVAEFQGRVGALFMYTNMYRVDTGSRQIIFTQLLGALSAGSKQATGVQTFAKRMRKSLFIEVPLEQTFVGTTVVTTEKFASGTTQNFFVTSLKKINLQISELEWNDFEKLLHVMTDNEVEARYVLTPDFMESLYLWWVEKKQDVRISFTGNSMYILFFGDQIQFGGDLADVSAEKIAQHVEAMLIPLAHSMFIINSYLESR